MMGASRCRPPVRSIWNGSSANRASLPTGEGYAWAAGEYSKIKAVRRHLVDVHGLDKGRIRAASYWRRARPATHEQFE